MSSSLARLEQQTADVAHDPRRQVACRLRGRLERLSEAINPLVMTLPAGTHLGPYEIRSPLGAGGMGEVYRAHDPRLDRDVAIKVLREETSTNPASLERFKREAMAVAALQHPNILSLYDIGSYGATTFAVMELLEGETLRSRLNRARLGWRDALEIGAQIADGLVAAHAKGIVHRDLKPENVFLTVDHRLKILDFGLARRHAVQLAGEDDTRTLSGTLPGTVLGTPGYMSPEQVRGELAAAPSDVFSLGCILHELISGRRTFSRGTPAETLAAILTATPPDVSTLVSDVPVELDRLIAHCLEKDPGERFQSARDLAFALRTMVSEPSGRRATIDSLAVLPFSTVGGGADSEYLGDGITETIINNLAQLPGLRVMARSTVFRHKGRDEDPIQIGRDLRVGAVLTGRVSQRGEMLVIGTELADVTNGSQLWGQQYKRKLADIFEIQDEISTEICEKLRLKLSGEQHSRLTRRYTGDPAAYQLYLKGRYCWNQRTEDGMCKAIDSFHQAIALDPGYARAFAGLGDCYALLSILGALAPHDGFAKAKAAERRALEIDDGLGEAHASLGFAALLYDFDPLTAGAELRKALELNPGYASAHQWYGFLLGLTGRLEASLAELKIAQELDPFSASINVTAAWPHYWMRRFDAAVVVLRQAVDLHPGFWLAHYYLGLALGQAGAISEALKHLEHARTLDDNPWCLSGLGHAYARAGRADDARHILEELKVRAAHRYVSPVHIATIYAGLGDLQAVDWLEHGLEDHSWLMAWLRVDALFDPIREDARFNVLVGRMRR
jgi:serine/threonine protein kinase/tetratricopeptide (TPR) repeat protein